ncbi:MAG TPA: hypothetical protein VMI56_24480 [Reyranella sp.]|nr:hypothetical protein [Reyranella sp.]
MSTRPRPIRSGSVGMYGRRMSGARLRNLFLLIAVFATFVAAGCWDNRRNMQHVLDRGYPVLVQITGAQPQRLAPFAFDGWRPRFVEQALSVDLKWDGHDGRQHTHAKVPVTEAFASTIVTGDQVRLAILPAKVLDDDLAVPVINADAAARFASLQQWLMASSWIAFAGWIGFAVMAFFFGRPGRALPSGTPVRTAFPPRRTLFGIASLVLGGALALHGWSAEADDADAGGLETMADITAAATIGGADGKPGSHVVQLAWKDARGSVHHYGPVPISKGFWDRIAPEGNLSVRQTRIRYREDAPQDRPRILEDAGEGASQYQAWLVGGLALMALGIALLASAARAVRGAGRR